MGGEGRNQILGYGSDDVLIGGAWQNPDTRRPETFQVWSSEVPFAVRQAMISELIDVTADDTPDSLFGGDGTNLYYASEFDLVVDGHSRTPVAVAEFLSLGWAQPHERWAGLFTMTPGVPESTATGEMPAEPTNPPTGSAESESQSASGSNDRRVESNPRDVNRDGFVSPQDVVVVINALNADRAGQVTEYSQYLDTNQDGWITPLDALGTVNYINTQTTLAEGEETAGESPSRDFPEFFDSGRRQGVNDARTVAGTRPSTSGHSGPPPLPHCQPDSSPAPDSPGKDTWSDLDDNLERVLNEIVSDIACAGPAGP